MSYTGVVATIGPLSRSWLKNKLRDVGVSIEEQIDPGPEKMTVFYKKGSRVLKISHLDKYAFTRPDVIDLDEAIKGRKLDAFYHLVHSMDYLNTSVGKLAYSARWNPADGDEVFEIRSSTGIFGDSGTAARVEYPSSAPIEFGSDRKMRYLHPEEVLEFYKSRTTNFSDVLIEVLGHSIRQGYDDLHQLVGSVGHTPSFTKGGIVSMFEPLRVESPFRARKELFRAFDIPVEIMGLPTPGLAFKRPESFLLTELFNHDKKYNMKDFTSKFWFETTFSDFRTIRRILMGSDIIIPFTGSFEGVKRFTFENGILEYVPKDVEEIYDIPKLEGWKVPMVCALMLINISKPVRTNQFVTVPGRGVCLVVQTDIDSIGERRIKEKGQIAVKSMTSGGFITTNERGVYICPADYVSVMTFDEIIRATGANLVPAQEKPVAQDLSEDPALDKLFYGLKGDLLDVLADKYPFDVTYQRAGLTVETFKVEKGLDITLNLKFELRKQKEPKKEGGPDYSQISNSSSALHNHLREVIHIRLSDFYKSQKMAIYFPTELGVSVDKNLVTGIDYVTFSWPISIRSTEVEVNLGCELKGENLYVTLERCKQASDKIKSELNKSSAEKRVLSKKEHDYKRILELTDTLYPLLHNPVGSEKFKNEIIDELTDLLNNYSELYS